MKEDTKFSVKSLFVTTNLIAIISPSHIVVSIRPTELHVPTRGSGLNAFVYVTYFGDYEATNRISLYNKEIDVQIPIDQVTVLDKKTSIKFGINEFFKEEGQFLIQTFSNEELLSSSEAFIIYFKRERD